MLGASAFTQARQATATTLIAGAGPIATMVANQARRLRDGTAGRTDSTARRLLRYIKVWSSAGTILLFLGP